jgi:hypothetical protein
MKRLLHPGLAAVALTLLIAGGALADHHEKSATMGGDLYVGPMEVGNRGFFNLTSAAKHDYHMKGMFGPMGPGGTRVHGKKHQKAMMQDDKKMEKK